MPALGEVNIFVNSAENRLYQLAHFSHGKNEVPSIHRSRQEKYQLNPVDVTGAQYNKTKSAEN